MKKPTILAIDDQLINLKLLGKLMSQEFELITAVSGFEGLQLLKNGAFPDLILLDVMMPELDGFRVLEILRKSPVWNDIPVILLTSLDSEHDEELGFACGANDFVSKPFKPAVLLARVRNHLQAKRARDLLRLNSNVLSEEVLRESAENRAIQKACIHALAHLAEFRDENTGGHLMRTQHYVRILCELLVDNDLYSEVLVPDYVDWLVLSAPLHDIGKVGIPDAILQKPGPLTVEERRIMQTHSARGREAIERAETDIGQPLTFLAVAKDIAKWHHERWDGSGYPDHLKGEEIPLSARIMAIADVFDAMTTRRIYKTAISAQDAKRYICGASGHYFDPALAEVFESGFQRFDLVLSGFL
ncbi:HD-GYP domain-containing protein [Paludibacterium purpuratum]|uniref:Putative two-component system response regulator n=1 Tax=Paludibacterium purpuratum TaxID=1144873 RepID=A0A4R7BD02_9NEIS|nr:HD domain-containing phosphohydrolase [Paludibacterium purpuratum]TDR81507.1 putative two-component system response regulator [Paludibacterium purpuratum]